MSHLAQKIRENRAVAVYLTFFGLLLAFFFIYYAITTLMTNEQNVLLHAKTLAEGKRLVISIESDQVDLSHEKSLVHLTAEMTTDETLIDPQFKIDVDAIKLRRIVEMYQWQEKHSKNESSHIEYIYEKIWSNRFIDSKAFKFEKHHNPTMYLNSKDFNAENVKIGHFILSPNIINKMTRYQKLSITELSFIKAQDNLQKLLQGKESHLNEGNFYVGKNPASPKIGDLRIKFELIRHETISIIAKQVNSNLVPYQTQTGNQIELFEYGVVSTNRMFINERISLFFSQFNKRFFGFFMMFLGIYVIFGLLWIAKTSLPFIKPFNIVGWLFSLILAAMLTLIIIGLTWKNSSPVMGRVLLVIAFASLYFLKYARKKQEILNDDPVFNPYFEKSNLIPEKFVPEKRNQ
jgi:hypothetical protein